MIPIVKWAGGKRQLLGELTKRMPLTYNNYFEPFIGGGALFFNLEPKNAVINDFNYELINLYYWIKMDAGKLSKKLRFLEKKYNNLGCKEQEEYYYQKRKQFNKRINKQEKLDIQDASLMIFLNKTCYNGLYRVNSNGLFNTPWNKKNNINLFADKLSEYSELLTNTTILQGDFENACRTACKNDFVYFDSPYYNTFDTYQAGGFSKEDHIRLKNLFDELTKKGVKCMLSNSDDSFILDLYSNYNIDFVDVKRMINCDGNKRTGTEVIITNYKKEYSDD